MEFRVIGSGEIGLIAEPMRELAAYHNRISRDFSGSYPVIPIEKHMRELAELVDAGNARVEIMLHHGRVAGFSAASFEGGYGEIDYLFVKRDLRGRQYGARLLDAMLAFLRGAGVSFVDLKVVHGNRARRFYERNGFKIRTDVLSMRLAPSGDAAAERGEHADFLRARGGVSGGTTTG